MSIARAPESLQLANVEVLFELFRGPHGAVHLGRMLKGIDSGRLVTLREVGALDASARAAIDVARSVAHPQLLKPLGVVRSESKHYLASEYVPGASLLELGSSVRASRFPLRPGVAVRIVKDALRAAESAQRLLRDAASLGYARCLFTDTVWIAEFGDVLLTDVNVAPLLANNPDVDANKAAAKDLLSAAIELFQLASGEALTAEVTSKLGAYVPAPLAETLQRAFGVNDKVPFLSIGDFVRALNELPPELQADEHEVSDELKRRLGTVLTQRKAKLSLLEAGAARHEEDADDVTRVFNTASLPTGTLNPDTLRPEATDEASAAALPRAPRAAKVENWQDLPTRVGHIGAAGAAFALRSDRPTQPASEATPATSASEPPSDEAAPAPVSKTTSAAPTQKGLPRAFWLVALALLATISAAWWATSTDTRSHHVDDPIKTR